MRRLMLLRHAKTERAAPGARDRERKLTQRGRDDAPAIGAYMVQHGLIPDLAVVSPAARAQQTWTLVAAMLPKAPRAVGQANGKNPIPMIVPCHRVLASNGIGGYGGGVPMKRTLLDTEGVAA